MKTKLKDICDIQFGCYEQTILKGTIPCLQLKNFDENNQFLTNIDTFVPHDKKTTKHLLCPEDILLPSKGNRLFAVLYQKEWGDMVASSIFYVIKVTSQNILPAYLSIVLNQPIYQQRLWQKGGGSNIFSLRKKELEDLTFPIPTLEIQDKIIKINSLHQKKTVLIQQIAKKEKQLYQSIIYQLIQQTL